jgi:hypothetical protein
MVVSEEQVQRASNPLTTAVGLPEKPNRVQYDDTKTFMTAFVGSRGTSSTCMSIVTSLTAT